MGDAIDNNGDMRLDAGMWSLLFPAQGSLWNSALIQYVEISSCIVCDLKLHAAPNYRNRLVPSWRICQRFASADSTQYIEDLEFDFQCQVPTFAIYPCRWPIHFINIPMVYQSRSLVKLAICSSNCGLIDDCWVGHTLALAGTLYLPYAATFRCTCICL